MVSDWTYWSDLVLLAATFAFAATAVIALRADRSIDVVGAIFLGVITAIGGGTLRDVILDVPVFWSTDPSYIWVAAVASVVVFYARGLFARKILHSLMLYLDALGVALSSIAVVSRVWHLGFGLPIAPVVLGIVTAIGGGLLRDILAGRTTLLMRPELYATPVLLGCTVFALMLWSAPDLENPAAIACVVGIFAMRAAAIHWNLSMPAWAQGRSNKEPAA